MTSHSVLLTIFLVISSGLSLITASCPSDAKKPWSFDYNLENGPQNWGETYMDCCSCYNKMQSPIIIMTDQLQNISGTGGLNLSNYDVPLTKALFNNTGYAMEVTPTDGVERSVIVNDTSYPLMAFILRVGNDTKYFFRPSVTPGSEHRVNSKQYSLEIQFIHGEPGGQIVIVSVFLDQSGFPDEALDKIFTLSAFRFTTFKGESINLNLRKSPRLDKLLLPGSPYYAYTGSLSFPPCTPGVYWLIIKKPLPVNYLDIYEFYDMRSVERGDPNADQCFIRYNFRKPQRLNDRTVYSVE